MRRLVLTLVLLLAAGAAAAQTDPRSPRSGTPMAPNPPREGAMPTPGIPIGHVSVGERAPDFELIAAGGKNFRLKTLRGHWVALFFADRREELEALSGLARTLDSLQFSSVVVFNERVQALTTWKHTGSMPLTALADERGEITAMYGLWDAPHAATRPGLFLLDPQGVVKLEVLGQRVSAPSLPALVQTAVNGL
jgi:peroxiredoxin